MIRLRILGGLELEGVDGREIHRVLAQPKRIALLVYLALSGTFVRRDRLLGLLWPESDTERARAALRQAVRFLRQHLGPDAVVNRGEEEIGIASSALLCDAAAFRHALAQGDGVRAVDLYRGELLPGFYLTDAPEFERWLESERAQLQRDATAVALKEVERVAASGDATTAIDLAHRAVAWSGDDESVIRRLLTILDSNETRPSALRLFDDFTRRLEKEFGLEASREIQLVAGEIRGRSAQASLTPQLEPRRILVLGLENRTGEPCLNHVGSMTADWIIQGLSEVSGFEVVPYTAALSSSDYFGQTVSGDERIRAVAVDQKAGTIVSGGYYKTGDDELRFHIRITDATTGTIRFALPPVSSLKSAPLAAIEALREQVRTVLASALEQRVTHTAAARPPTYEGYRHYIEGIELFIRGAWSGALEHFEQSAVSDPDYALPLIVSAIARWNRGELEAAESLAREAASRRKTLRPFEAAVLDMVNAWLQGDWAAAHESARRQAQLAPGSIPSFQVAEEARRLNRPAEAVRVLSRLDPTRGELRGWIFYWLELTTALHMQGHHSEELNAAAVSRDIYRDDPTVLLMEVRAHAAMGNAGEVARLIDERLALGQYRYPDAGTLMRDAALELRAHGFPEPADVLFRQSLSWYLSARDNAPAMQRNLGRAHYHAGHWNEAREIFSRLRGAGPEYQPSDASHHAHLGVHLDLGYLGVLAMRTGELDEAARVDAELDSMRSSFLYGRNSWWRAAMAALAGDRDRSIELLRQSFADGMPMEIFLHADPHFETMRGHEPFDQLMFPR